MKCQLPLGSKARTTPKYRKSWDSDLYPVLRSKTIPTCDQVSHLSCCSLALASLGNKVPSVPTVGKAEELFLYHIPCSYCRSRECCVKGSDPGVRVCCRWQLQLGQSCSVAWRSAPREPCPALGGSKM